MQSRFLLVLFVIINVAQICLGQDFKARNLQGIQLGMTPIEVERVTGMRLKPLGRGDFKFALHTTAFNLGFTPAGHLYRIDSDETLGGFQPDLQFAKALSKKLIKKFGPPEENDLPGGTINWGLAGIVHDHFGTNPREFERLSARLGGGFGQPIHLIMQMLDFRVLWRDQSAINAGSRDKAICNAQF